MIDPTRPPDVAHYDDLVRRLERLERTVRLANLGAQAVTDDGIAHIPGTSWGAVTGAPSVEFAAPASGKVLALFSVNATLEVSSGWPPVELRVATSTPGVSDFAHVIVLPSPLPTLPSASTWSEVLEGLTPATVYTLGVYGKRWSSGSILTFTLNFVTVAVVPL